jgi:hypothetical protein
MGWRIRALGELLLVLVGASMGGCATAPKPMLYMTYHSDPEGATLYLGGQLIGYTPVTRVYPSTTALFQQYPCVHLDPMQARWASGAVVSANAPVVCIASGWSQQYVLVRPVGPGAEIDANFALQLQQNAIQLQRNGVMQQQADAQDATAVAEYLRSQSAATRSKAGQ